MPNATPNKASLYDGFSLLIRKEITEQISALPKTIVKNNPLALASPKLSNIVEEASTNPHTINNPKSNKADAFNTLLSSPFLILITINEIIDKTIPTIWIGVGISLKKIMETNNGTITPNLVKIEVSTTPFFLIHISMIIKETK